MIEHLDGIFERVSFREDLTFRINYLKVHEDFPDHWHAPLEIVRASRNWYEVRANGCTYRLEEGDIAVILPGTVHALCAPASGSRTIYLADIAFLKEIASFETLLALLPPVTVLSPLTDKDLHAKVSSLLTSMEMEYDKSSSFLIFLYTVLLCICWAPWGGLMPPPMPRSTQAPEAFPGIQNAFFIHANILMSTALKI